MPIQKLIATLDQILKDTGKISIKVKIEMTIIPVIK